MATTNAATKPPQIAPKTTSRIGAVRKGIIRAPRRIFIYGAEGTGKSSLAADSDNPIFIDADGGSMDLDIARYPFRDDANGHVPQSFSDVLSAVTDLGVSEHKYRTLVLDTGDAIEKLIWQHVIERESQPSARNKDGELASIESFGYGKGYVMAVDEWRSLCVRLDRLRMARQMGIVILAHAAIKNFKNPSGPDFDRWVPAVHAQAAGFLKGWSDIVGMLCHEETTIEKKGAKAKGISTGIHVLKLAHSAAFDAKGRGNLPDEVEIPRESPWAPFAAAIDAGHEVDAAKLASQIKDETDRIGDADLTDRVNAAVKSAVAKNDTPSLITYLNNLKTRSAKSAEAQQ
jgi:hypothetical protein